MAENSFKEWWSDLQENKKSRKQIELLKSKSNNISNIKNNKVLFISNVNGLGDAIMLRGVLKSFIDDGYEITLITKKYHKDAFYDLNIKNIFLWDDLENIKFDEYNLAIGHHKDYLTYKVLLEIPAKNKYIINSQDEFKDFIIINTKNKPNNIWEVYDNFLSQFGYQYNLIDFKENKELFNKLNLEKDNYIAIHIGSGSLCKNWGIENFINLSKELDKLKIDYYFLAGPFEKDILDKYQLDNIVSNLEFSKLIEVVRNAKMVVCHGTSILHLSVTVGTPTISINSTYDYRFWHPYKELVQYKDKHIALTSKSSTECSKYRRLIDFGLGLNKDGCPILKKEIKVSDVLEYIID